MKLKFLLSLDKSNKFRFLLLIIFGIFVSIIELLSLNMIIPLTTKLINLDNSNFFLNSFINYNSENIIYILILIFIFLILIKNFFNILYNYLVINFTHFNYVISSTKIFKKIMNYEYDEYNNLTSSSFLNEVKELPGALRFYLEAILFYYIELALVSFIGIFLIYISSSYSLLPMGTLVVLLILYGSIFKKKMYKWGEEKINFSEKSNKDLITSYNNYILIHLLNKFDFFYKNVQNSFSNYSHYQKLAAFVQSISRNTIEIIVVLIILILLLIYKETFDLKKFTPLLALYLVGFFRIMPSANRLLNLKFNIKAGEFAVNKIREILSKKENEIIENKVNEVTNFYNTINFKNIYFKYKEKEIFKNFNFTIEKNKVNGIIGKSGSGKSTLTKILMGFLRLNDGKILLDNKTDVTNNIKKLRGMIGYTGQNFYFFKGSLLSNISLSYENDETKISKVKHSLELSKSSDFINKKNLELHDTINENVSEFSDGQRQRLAIARALFFEPKILILDEATSFLDITTEKSILEDLKKIEGLTIVLISHRKETINYCDNIINLDEI